MKKTTRRPNSEARRNKRFSQRKRTPQTCEQRMASIRQSIETEKTRRNRRYIPPTGA